MKNYYRKEKFSALSFEKRKGLKSWLKNARNFARLMTNYQVEGQMSLTSRTLISISTLDSSLSLNFYQRYSIFAFLIMQITDQAP
jgi:hypothetical protein